MITFNEALRRVPDNTQNTVLLGNGFSQAWNHEIFNYQNLYEAADFGQHDATLRQIFDQLQTYDFERVSKELLASERILAIYDPGNPLIARFMQGREVLENALVEAISQTHPDLPGEIEEHSYVSVINFLLNFNKIYTVNYDLLLYWSRNQNLQHHPFRSYDGFREELRWIGRGTGQNVYFLHGGLHIYEDANDVKKHAYSTGKISIIEQVRENLRLGRYPLFVSEPNFQRKKNRIEHNPYLSYCYHALAGLTGSIFIHGHSMDENDRHIFDKLRESSISRVFVSIFGDEESEENRATQANARRFLRSPTRELFFYQAETANVWG